MRKRNTQSRPSIPFGVLSTGETVCFNLSAPSHIALQGMTRSGKSAAVYHFLASLTQCGVPVRVSMVDPTGVLGAPMESHSAAGSLSLGTQDASSAVAVVDAVLADMHDRVSQLWNERTDKWTTWTPARPLHLLVVEEAPGLVEWLADEDAAEGRKTNQRLAPRFVAGLRQIMAQGLKVGVVVLVMAQRMDASVISGPARSNIGIRICLRMDDPDGARMLFPGTDADVIAELATALPGRGLVTTPDHRMEKVRLLHCDYSAYVSSFDT